jgi:hypothetical protein
MSWFHKSTTVEVIEPEPPQSDADKLAEASREAIFAEEQFNQAVINLRSYNVAHEQMAFSYRHGDQLFVQTFVCDAERRSLEKGVRESLGRRNLAWSRRAQLLFKTGRIR